MLCGFMRADEREEMVFWTRLFFVLFLVTLLVNLSKTALNLELMQTSLRCF